MKNNSIILKKTILPDEIISIISFYVDCFIHNDRMKKVCENINKIKIINYKDIKEILKIFDNVVISSNAFTGELNNNNILELRYSVNIHSLFEDFYMNRVELHYKGEEMFTIGKIENYKDGSYIRIKLLGCSDYLGKQYISIIKRIMY